jgi:hypothetical protein
MVATWAEKEMRNLQRMHQAGLPVPKPQLLKVPFFAFGSFLFLNFRATSLSWISLEKMDALRPC